MDKKSLVAISVFLLAVIFLLAVCFWAWRTDLSPDPVLVKIQKNDHRQEDMGDLPSGSLRTENMAVFEEERDGINYLILKKNGIETIVDQGMAKYDPHKPFLDQKEVRSFSVKDISPGDRYLIYDAWSYEAGQSYVYDMAEKKLIFSNPWPLNIEFAKTDETFFVCGGEPLRGWREARVLSTKSYMTIFDAQIPTEIKFPKIECAFDRDEESVTFNVTETKVSSKQARRWKTIYFLKTGQQETVSAKPECGEADDFSQNDWWSDFKSKVEKIDFYDPVDLPSQAACESGEASEGCGKDKTKKLSFAGFGRGCFLPDKKIFIALFPGQNNSSITSIWGGNHLLKYETETGALTEAEKEGDRADWFVRPQSMEDPYENFYWLPMVNLTGEWGEEGCWTKAKFEYSPDSNQLMIVDDCTSCHAWKGKEKNCDNFFDNVKIRSIE